MIDSLGFETENGKMEIDVTPEESRQINKKMASFQNLNLSPVEEQMAFIQSIESVKGIDLSGFKEEICNSMISFWTILSPKEIIMLSGISYFVGSLFGGASLRLGIGSLLATATLGILLNTVGYKIKKDKIRKTYL